MRDHTKSTDGQIFRVPEPVQLQRATGGGLLSDAKDIVGWPSELGCFTALSRPPSPAIPRFFEVHTSTHPQVTSSIKNKSHDGCLFRHWLRNYTRCRHQSKIPDADGCLLFPEHQILGSKSWLLSLAGILPGALWARAASPWIPCFSSFQGKLFSVHLIGPYASTASGGGGRGWTDGGTRGLLLTSSIRIEPYGKRSGTTFRPSSWVIGALAF